MSPWCDFRGAGKGAWARKVRTLVREQRGDDTCSCMSVCPPCTSLRFCLPVFLGLGWSQRIANHRFPSTGSPGSEGTISKQASKTRMAAKTYDHPDRMLAQTGETKRTLRISSPEKGIAQGPEGITIVIWQK